MSVVLVDAGGTNIGSVRYALQRLGVDAALTADASQIRSADKVILPGVGAAGPGMARLRELQLVDVIRSLTQPVLGVCLGMQLLCDAFGRKRHGLSGCYSGRCVIAFARHLASVFRIWVGTVYRRPRNIRLLKDLEEGDWAYFVHSYAVPIGDYTLASTDYGSGFSSIIASGNFHGMQFHPERSASVGAKLLKNFLEL